MAKLPLQRLRHEPADEQEEAERASEAERDDPAPRRIIKRTISFLHLDDRDGPPPSALP
jgi:hypothetical protein